MSGFGEYPYGLQEVKIVPVTGSLVTLPAARQLQWRERIQNAELRGNDKTVAAVAMPDAVEWTLEEGGISLEALAAMTGRTATAAGTTPSRTVTMAADAGTAFPYFKMYGKALGDGADDVHVKFFKCKVTGIEGSFGDGEFLITSCSGIAIDDGTNGIYTVVQNETAATLPTS
jgi:hypothetical protein